MEITAPCDFCGQIVSRRKQAASKNVLRHFCGMDCKASFQKLAKPVTKEWLEQKYLTEGLDCVQIGKIVSRDPKSVWNWMKDFGIPTRPRGSDVRQHFVKGDPNPFAGMKHTAETKERLRKIAIADGRKPYKEENGPPWAGVTGDTHPSWKGGRTPERQAFYSSKEWVEAVKTVWHRADARCERCGLHHNNAKQRGTFHVHHIVTFQVRSLRAEPTNLALLCTPCHRWVHSKDNHNKEWIGNRHGRD